MKILPSMLNLKIIFNLAKSFDTDDNEIKVSLITN